MKAFQILLVFFIVGIFIYTGMAIKNQGWNLIPFFLGDLVAMNWSGQFNFDFSCYLILSGLWIAWRNDFTLNGCILAVIGYILGIIFFAPYLLFLIKKTNGNMKEILIGKKE